MIRTGQAGNKQEGKIGSAKNIIRHGEQSTGSRLSTWATAPDQTNILAAKSRIRWRTYSPTALPLSRSTPWRFSLENCEHMQ